MELMQASRQWSSRPDDQRFISLLDLHEHVAASRKNSVAKVISSRQITVRPHQNDELNGIEIIGPNGGPVVPTHWAFGQLCQRAGAPAKYMRQLPAPMVSDCINYGMHVARNVEDVGAMLHRNGGEPELRALTGPNYGRIWCESISGALIDRFGDGREGQWTVPGEFGKAVEVTKENTTLYASDRDMWIFLADEKNRIEIPNRRDGSPVRSLAASFSGTRRSAPNPSASRRSCSITPAAIGSSGARSSTRRSGFDTLPVRLIAGSKRSRPSSPRTRSRAAPRSSTW